MPDPQIPIGSTLIDAEQHLAGVHRIRQGIQSVVLRLAPLQPPQGPLTAGLGIVVLGRIFHALVKGHGDIRAQMGLDLHTLLRPHEDAVAVQMAGEGDALLRDLPQTRQREHLKAAGVRQDGAVPPHEPVQPSHLPHHVIAGAQVQVVGIGQLDLASQLLQVEGIYAPLDGPLCSHVHEYRRLHLAAVGAPETAPTGGTLRFNDLKHGISPLSSWLYFPYLTRLRRQVKREIKRLKRRETYSIIYVTEFSRKLRKKQVIFYENQ